MSIRLLKTLVAVAEERTFSAAAQRIHVTHAAVSQHMRALEAELGIALFDRSTRTPTLTPLAHEVVTRARKLIADYEGLVPSILADGGFGDTVALGVLPTTLTGLAPRAMSVLRKRYPQMGLHLRPGLSRSLLSDVARGTLDAALISRPHQIPFGMRFRQVSEETMHLIAAPDAIGNDPMQLLRDQPFIRFNRSAVVGILIDNWLDSHRIRVQEAMELDSLEAISSMVRAQLGVSIVPDLSVKPVQSLPLKRLPLGPDAPVRRIGLVYKEDALKTRAIDAIFAALCDVISQDAPMVAEAPE